MTGAMIGVKVRSWHSGRAAEEQLKALGLVIKMSWDDQIILETESTEMSPEELKKFLFDKIVKIRGVYRFAIKTYNL